MPDTPIPIPSLPAASTLTGSELVPGDQAGTTVKMTTSAIAALAAGGVTGVGLSGTPRTGTIVLAPGTNLAIVESPSGTFTFNASSGAGAGDTAFTIPAGVETKWYVMSSAAPGEVMKISSWPLG